VILYFRSFDVIEFDIFGIDKFGIDKFEFDKIGLHGKNLLPWLYRIRRSQFG
jgi:hypothetical protein